jgi:inorganic pyrophosphatase
MNRFSWLIACLLLCLAGCGPGPNAEQHATYTPEGHLRAVIEIPAGTNHKISYDPKLRTFAIEQQDGHNRVIDFLPYPANYGFIPSTRLNGEVGGDGDPLDVFVIAESLPSAITLEVIPLAVIETTDEGELDPKILAVPLRDSRRVIRATTLAELRDDYPAIIEIMTLWLRHYDPGDSTRVLRWGDEREAQAMIERWRIR